MTSTSVVITLCILFGSTRGGHSVPGAAQELLGLSDVQSRKLFYIQSNQAAIDYLGDLIKDAHNER